MPAGRPRSSSRATIEEAAGELFLERGYAATSLADIAQRAGVGRATLFGYVRSKSDLLWLELDAVLDDLEERVASGEPLRAALDAAAGAARVPLAVAQAEAMGASAEIAASGPSRTARLERIVARGLPASGLAARVRQRAIAAAVAAAWETWALAGARRGLLRERVATALAELGDGIRIP